MNMLTVKNVCLGVALLFLLAHVVPVAAIPLWPSLLMVIIAVLVG